MESYKKVHMIGLHNNTTGKDERKLNKQIIGHQKVDCIIDNTL